MQSDYRDESSEPTVPITAQSLPIPSIALIGKPMWPSGTVLSRGLMRMSLPPSRLVTRSDVYLTGGCKRTAEFAAKHGKPWLHLAAERSGEDGVGALKRFIECNGIRVSNVAGSRASRDPNVAQFVTETLLGCLSVAVARQCSP